MRVLWDVELNLYEWQLTENDERLKMCQENKNLQLEQKKCQEKKEISQENTQKTKNERRSSSWEWMMKMMCIGKVEWLEPERNGCDMVREIVEKLFPLFCYLHFTFIAQQLLFFNSSWLLQPFL